MFGLFAAISVFFLSACGGASPETVLTRYYGALADNRIDDAFSCYCAKNLDDESLVKAVRSSLQSAHSAIAQMDGFKSLEMKTVEKSKDAVVIDVIKRYGNGEITAQRHRVIKDGGEWKIFLEVKKERKTKVAAAKN
jgi:hypothetical protein